MQVDVTRLYNFLYFELEPYNKFEFFKLVDLAKEMKLGNVIDLLKEVESTNYILKSQNNTEVPLYTNLFKVLEAADDIMLEFTFILATDKQFTHCVPTNCVSGPISSQEASNFFGAEHITEMYDTFR